MGCGSDLVDSLQRSARLAGSGAFQDDITLVVFSKGKGAGKPGNRGRDRDTTRRFE
jgi:hypothetical protein